MVFDLAADAVHDDPTDAVGAHEEMVVGLLQSGLSDDSAAAQPLEVGERQLRVGDLADVAERVRGHLLGRVMARRDFLDDHVRKLALARRDRRDLRQRRIVDHHDRPILRLVAMAIHDLVELLLVDLGGGRKQPDRSIQILGLLPAERDAEHVAVLDQHPAIAVEEDAAGCAERQRALVIVLSQLQEPGMLRHLEVPEAGRQRDEHEGDDIAHDGHTHVLPASVAAGSDVRHLPLDSIRS